MHPCFNTPERIARLTAEAHAWLGTPWSANAASPGRRGGVSCHNLPRAILMASGALAPDFPVLIGDPTGSRHTKVSVLEPWIDAWPSFARVPHADLRLLQPGDLIGLRIAHCLDHLGLILTGENFIHVLAHKNTSLDPYQVPPWSQRILAAWRPLEVPA